MRKACIAFLCLSALCFGQAALAPPPKLQFFDSNGKPLSGGLIWTYASGTTNPLATYTDATGATPNQNPIVLDAGGFAAIWLSNSAYTFDVRRSDGTPLYVTNNIVANGATGTIVTSVPNGVIVGTKTKLSDDAANGNGILLIGDLSGSYNGTGQLGDSANRVALFASTLNLSGAFTGATGTFSTSVAAGGGQAITNTSHLGQNVGVYNTITGGSVTCTGAGPYSCTITIPSSFGITASSYCDVFPMDTTAAAYTSTSVTPGTNSVVFGFTGTANHPVRFTCYVS